MITLSLLNYALKTRTNEGLVQVWDPIRKSWIGLTPEEHVRQLLLQYLLTEMKYPPGLISIERGVSFGHTVLRFDIVVYHRDTHQPWLLAECKSPEVPLTDAVLQQLLRYHSKMPGCRYWLISNGIQTLCADASNRQSITWLNALPTY